MFTDDSTEYECQHNGLAEVAVRKFMCVPRAPWLVARAAGQMARGQFGPVGQTPPHQRKKGRAFRKMLLVSGESTFPEASGRVDSRDVGAVDCSWVWQTGAQTSTWENALGVVSSRSLR